MMTTLLGDIYSDDLLSRELCFKGGTAVYLFGNLPRFSTDLDFNLRHKENEEAIYRKLREITARRGNIVDSAVKHFGPLVVMSYAKGERNLKLEVSNRQYDNHYEPKPFVSRHIPVMVDADMFSHKLCAVLERQAPRDIYDTWHFASRGTSLNPHIVYERTGKTVPEILSRCADKISSLSSKYLMAGLGDVLLNEKDKNFVRTRLVTETEIVLRAMAESPLLSNLPPTTRTRLLETDSSLIPYMLNKKLDVASITEEDLFTGIQNGSLQVKDAEGKKHTVPFPGKPSISDFLGVFEGVSEAGEGIYIVKRDDGKFNYARADKSLVVKNWLDKADPFQNGQAVCTIRGQKVKINTSGVVTEVLSQGVKKGLTK